MFPLLKKARNLSFPLDIMLKLFNVIVTYLKDSSLDFKKYVLSVSSLLL